MEEKNEMDRGMEQIPSDKHSGILKTAHKYKIEENDPAWILVRLAIDSISDIENVTVEATKALREASVAVTAATSAEDKAARDKAALEITKLQEAAKASIASALTSTLENEIRNAVSRLQSQSNSPLHKKWLIGMGAGLLVAVCLGGWGTWNFFKYAKSIGAADEAAYANPESKAFYHLMECDRPGWKAKWVKDRDGNTVLYCYPHPDQTGNIYGWRIR
jgi:hypothetical protein